MLRRWKSFGLLIVMGTLGGVCAIGATLAMRPRTPPFEVRVEKEVVYREGAAEKERPAYKVALDVYQPVGAMGKRPGVVLIHGGGWMFGDKSSYAKLGTTLAQKGYVAFSLNYRHAPIFRHPAQVDDAQRAVRWIRAHADQWNLDPDRIGALGDSAGGHLSAMLGVRDTRDNRDSTLARYSSRVQCVVDLYGPADLTLPPDSPGVSKEAMQILKNFFGKSPSEAPDLYRDASPIVFIDRKTAPFLIFHGDSDKLVPLSQSERLHAALKRADIESELVVLSKEGHGFKLPENQKRVQETAEAFLAKHLKP